MYFVYVLKSLTLRSPRDKKYYIGYSSNVLYRISQHNSILNTGYTRGRSWKLVYLEAYRSQAVALDRERKLKQYGNVWQGVMRRIKESLDPFEL